MARTNPVPGMAHENALARQGAEFIGGVDEVGVGAWAGPVTVGAVVLRPGTRIYKVRDSKLLDEPRRRWLASRVRQQCLCWSVGMSWPREIDDVGLSEAIRRAGARALGGLAVRPDAILADGNWNFLKERCPNVKMIVRGDCESVSIACASIVAKVSRDEIMVGLASLYPFYFFESNKGYPSPFHKWALAGFGPSPVHRRLFAPVQKLVDEGAPGRLLKVGVRQPGP
ncbi:MAG: ribonuclease HII [Actinomycetota bacterium]